MKTTEKETEKKSRKSATADAEESARASKQRQLRSFAERDEKQKKLILSILSYVIGVCALLLVVLFIADFAGSSAWFTVFCRILFALFSWSAITIPALMVYSAVFLPKLALKKEHVWNLVLAGWLCLTISVLLGVILVKDDTPMGIVDVWKAGAARTGAGIIGTYVGWLLVHALSRVGAYILVIALLAAQIIFLVGLTLDDAFAFFGDLFKKLWTKIKTRVRGLFTKKKTEEDPGAERKKAAKKTGKVETDDDDDELVFPAGPARGTVFRDKPRVDDNPYADDDQKLPDPVSIPRPGAPKGWDAAAAEDPAVAANSGVSAKVAKKSDPTGGKIDLDSIFVEPGSEEEEADEEADPNSPVIGQGEEASEDAQGTRRMKRMSGTAPGEKEEKKEYVFPPIKLLTAIPQAESDNSEELTTNARRLVETLSSFRVRTKVVNVSRGPTITRYELKPEEGVRVRQIANLVDDISLSLATSGVRIEAPIPGKPAVGVEVPNKNRETVYLRTLLENDRFLQSGAKLTAAIGVDVAGDPVYVDLAKMPHLLIAGTTGSGKSVCLNCLILSVLYKASPDEVKLIMIDPKKVEFNVYNGLPHLIIPVVSNAKKAAGALSWAVSEMERRYELIEQVGVREIKSYNKATANDPEREFMPQLLIVIDELADLMMTAPAEVEESICRIAQKGRACGMHLIIGTQRPSVDVITGLIKANVPSRVAFTVSSQVDSRTIIDIAGAEKLIGRGDMLFAPVGAMKPARLQGAFVSDEEVEAVTEFIKEHSEEAVYDDQVLKDIEKEAALCGSKGKKSAGHDEGTDPFAGADADADPMLKPAIDLAVEEGKISTSLIQRRLSLGYGRAAKLLDEMQNRGIVSPPDGQKPRTVLISASEWHEMCMRSADEE